MTDIGELCRTFYEEVVGRGKLSLIEELVSPFYIDHNSDARAHGPDAVRAHLESLRSTFPDFSMEVEQLLRDGDFAITRVSARGTHLGEWQGIRPSGRQIRLRGINIDRFSNGKIEEHWGEADTVGMLVQMGLNPFTAATTGQKQSPKEVVLAWVDRFNSADAAGLAELYQPDAVNHQVAEQPVEGRDNIQAMFEREFAVAEMVCIPEEMHECGDVVALEWRDPLGLRGCGFFTIRDGRIAFQRGYWDKLSFLKAHGLPVA